MKMCVCLLLLALVTGFNSFAQDAGKIHELLLNLKRVNTDTARAEIYANLCINYCALNTDSALYFGNKAMQLSVKTNYEKGIADANNNIGWAYYCKGEYVPAQKHLTAALEQFTKIGNKEFIAIPLANLGSLSINQSNYPAALSFFLRAFKYLEDAGAKSRAAEMLYNVGRIYNLEKNPVKARSYFQQAYDLHKEGGEDLYMAQALSSIANTYQLEEKYDTALLYYKRTIPVFSKHHDVYRTGNAYENISIAYQNKKQYSQALINMLQAKKLYQQLNNKVDLAYAYSGIADIYFHLGDIEQAINNYKISLQLAADASEKNLQQFVLAGLSNVYLKKNDYKNAYLLLDSSYKIKDSLFTQEKQNALLKLQTEFETVRKEKENQLLKTQNLSAALKLEHNKELLIGAGLFIFFLALLLYALFKNRQVKIKNIRLLKNLNVQLEKQKEEITRINTILELKALRAQMNPHFIFNCMSSIQECMLTGRVDDANTYLTKLSRLLRMVLNYSDEESVSLDIELQMLNLYLQLEKIRLKNNFDYSVEIDNEVLEEELEVPTLILQPFAENAIWHGLVNKQGERKLVIKGEIKNEMLHFTINDNGIGRVRAKELKPASALHKSKGIALVQKRLDIIKTKTNNPQTGFIILDLYNNESSAGTSVEINLPLKAI